MEDAGRDLAEALKKNPSDVDALALTTIVELASNRQDQALATPRRRSPPTPSRRAAQVALSYAQQAKFDLEGARASLETAVTLEPANALAWARLAEIRSSFGERGAALEAADKAVALEPNLSRTQTVLGFAHLTRVEIGEARSAFAKAIALDQADPAAAARASGCARIRDGALAEGAREIEVAASLDPGRRAGPQLSRQGLLRGEARRPRRARVRHGASRLDPNDPTPWFYDAIAKQTTNRPVEALHDIEEAIELNDNRAVYRSRLLLDSDLAARSASLGRIYGDLGFQSLALVEGWNSVNADPANYSGPPPARRLLRRPAAPRDRAGERAVPVAAAPAAQHSRRSSRASARAACS